MKRIALLAAAVAALASAGPGCRGEPPPPRSEDPTAAPARPADLPAPTPRPPPDAAAGPPPAYAEDIGKLCDVVRRAGAADAPAGDRQVTVATWLAANLTTAEARQFLVRIQPLVGDQKAEALEAEARRVGLSGCALAAEWRTPPTPPAPPAP